MKPHLQCAEQQVSRSNLTKCCACHAERLTCLIIITYETSFTMRKATRVTIQPHQILRLSRRETHILSHHHIWNVIYNARSNMCHHPTSPNTAPATKNDWTPLSSWHMKPHFQCAEQQVSCSNLTKYCACHEKWHCKISKKISKKRWNVISNAGPIRAWSDHDPSMIRPWKRKPQPASQVRLLFQLTTSIFYCKIQRFAPNLTFKPSPNTAPATKSDTWTSPSTAPATKSDTWTSPNIAPATKSNTWTSPSTAPATKSDTWSSPNTAPATQKDSLTWSSSRMKPHLQCGEQQVSPSNLTKYRACHTKWLTCLIVVTYETSFPMRGATGITIQPHQILRLPRKMTLQDSKKRWNVISNAGPIRAWSDHDPTMIRPWKRKPQPASQVRLLFQLTTSIFYCKIQRFAPNLTFKPSPNTAPATKSGTWTSLSTAPATKSDTWTSPSTAPATKSDTRTSLL